MKPVFNNNLCEKWISDGPGLGKINIAREVFILFLHLFKYCCCSYLRKDSYNSVPTIQQSLIKSAANNQEIEEEKI